MFPQKISFLLMIRGIFLSDEKALTFYLSYGKIKENHMGGI